MDIDTMRTGMTLFAPAKVIVALMQADDQSMQALRAGDTTKS